MFYCRYYVPHSAIAPSILTLGQFEVQFWNPPGTIYQIQWRIYIKGRKHCCKSWETSRHPKVMGDNDISHGSTFLIIVVDDFTQIQFSITF